MEGCEEFCKKKKNRDVPGCEKYHKGDGGKGCCKANTAECLACSEGKSVKRFCKKYKRRGSLGEKDRDDSRQKEDRDDSRQQEDGGFFRWLLQQLFGGRSRLNEHRSIWMPLVVPSHPRSAWSPFLERFFGGFTSSPCMLISYLT